MSNLVFGNTKSCNPILSSLHTSGVPTGAPTAARGWGGIVKNKMPSNGFPIDSSSVVSTSSTTDAPVPEPVEGTATKPKLP